MKTKMITVATVDGTILDFGDGISEPIEIVIGTKATVDSSPASGEFVLTDGRTLVFVDGKVTKILEPSLVMSLKIEMKLMAEDLKSFRAMMIPSKEIKTNNHRKLWKGFGE